MKFQPGDRVKYIGESASDLKLGSVYTVESRHKMDVGVHLVGFPFSKWWYDYRFELVTPEKFFYAAFIDSRYGSTVKRFKNEEELKNWIDKQPKSGYNSYELFKCIPVKANINIEIEE